MFFRDKISRFNSYVDLTWVAWCFASNWRHIPAFRWRINIRSYGKKLMTSVTVPKKKKSQRNPWWKARKFDCTAWKKNEKKSSQNSSWSQLNWAAVTILWTTAFRKSTKSLNCTNEKEFRPFVNTSPKQVNSSLFTRSCRLWLVAAVILVCVRAWVRACGVCVCARARACVVMSTHTCVWVPVHSKC